MWETAVHRVSEELDTTEPMSLQLVIICAVTVGVFLRVLLT